MYANPTIPRALSAIDADVRATIGTYAQTHGAEVAQLLQSYSRSWSAVLSRTERAELIATIWEPEGSYSDPTAVDVSHLGTVPPALDHRFLRIGHRATSELTVR